MLEVRTIAMGMLLVAAMPVGCGDDDEGGGDQPDASTGDGDGDGDGDADAGGDVDAGVLPDEPTIVPLSATGTDELLAVAFAADGTFYAAGFVADGVTPDSDRSMVLARFLPGGELDPSFSDDGIATVNVAVGGGDGELARGIAIQSTGKVVIGGVIEHDVAATGAAALDRDIAVVRFNADGTVDDTFGDEGIRILDLNTGLEVDAETLAGPDLLWSLSAYADDRLLVHGASRALDGEGDPRVDTDWAAARLTADGDLDDSFGDGGVHRLDLQEADASARQARVLVDGSVIAGGYANTPGLGSTQPVVYKLTPDGDLDGAFGNGGVFHEIVLGAVTEVYSLEAVGDKVVTAGYGRNSLRETNDWVSLRLNADGTLDPTWGDKGAVQIDFAEQGDNCRNMVALPGGGVLLTGSGGVDRDGVRDAALALLDSDGAPDERFGRGGRQLHDLGGTDDGFWDAAVSPAGDSVAIVGYKGFGQTATEAQNDDAAVYVIPLP